MATKNRGRSIQAVAVLLSTAGASAEAGLPIVSRTASGTGTVQYLGSPTGVTDSASTNDPTIQGIGFRAQQDVEGQPNVYFVSHGQASMYVESGLRLGRLDDLEIAYYGGSGGTASGMVTSVVELDLPSDAVVLECILANHGMDFPRTFGIVAENVTDQNVLVDAAGPIASSIMLTGHEGDRIRVLLEATMSGSVPPESLTTIGSLSMRVWIRNVEDCNGNGRTDDLDEQMGVGFDCNDNLILDSCDLAAGTSVDCNGNGIPDECETDCNGNGVQDTCDISAGTSTDCNLSGVPDECENLPDCNGNLVVDVCDLVNGTSEDCDETGVPDECEPPQPDCNNNAVGDGCDVRDGFSTDCNFDVIPDECQPDEDCNDNGVRDICDIGAGTSADCNQNLVPDSCDIASGTSLDADGNGIPDECPVPPLKGSDDKCVGGQLAGQPCAQHSDCPGGACHLKNRFLTFHTGSIGSSMRAIRVVLAGLDPDSVANPAAFNGQVRYVQPPTLGVNDGTSPPFNAAILGCTYYAQDWSSVGQLHVYGSEIVPRSTYDVYACSSETLCSLSALRIGTARFGDATSPLVAGQPNFQDIYVIVNKFQNRPSSLSKTRTKIEGVVPNPMTPVSFLDISADVAAFQGKTFKNVFPVGPQTCP